MKVRTDILRMYKEIHGWVGIISGLALFIAFYAGAITMFEEPLQRWASPPNALAKPVAIERTPELIAAVLAEHPEAARSYDVHFQTAPENPARVSWVVRGTDEHAEPETFYAAFRPDGSLQVEQQGPSPVAQFVDVLHQQVGLPFEHDISMLIMGGIALLYFIALVSGIIVLLPSLISDFFALRVGKNVKRMWLDLHNVLGILSVPFHIIMALTAVVFAFHDQFYDLQDMTFAKSPTEQVDSANPPNKPDIRSILAPAELASRIEAQAPGFTVRSANYHQEPDGSTYVRVTGEDPRYGHRTPTYGIVEADAHTGEFTETDYMPGNQSAWGATVTSFFTLHFGSFGGTGVRWAYFLLGLAGAFLFYTGNLLWVESRRKRERKSGRVTQTKSTRILASVTVGIPLGCVSGIAVTVAAAKPMGLNADIATHSAIYYAVFLVFTIWALIREAPRASVELLPLTAVALACIPISSIVFGEAFPVSVPLVDIFAAITAAGTLLAWRSARRRVKSTPYDSVWSKGPITEAAVAKA